MNLKGVATKNMENVEKKSAKLTLFVSPEVYEEIGESIIGNALDMLADVAEQELGILMSGPKNLVVEAVLVVGHRIIVKGIPVPKTE